MMMIIKELIYVDYARKRAITFGHVLRKILKKQCGKTQCSTSHALGHLLLTSCAGTCQVLNNSNSLKSLENTIPFIRFEFCVYLCFFFF